MGTYTKIAKMADLPPGRGKVCEVNGKKIALFNVDGRFYAVDNTCVHRGGPVGEGELEGCFVTCPWHGWRYDVRTGQSETNPSARLASYATRLDGDEVHVEV